MAPNNELLNARQFQGDMQFGFNARLDFYRLWNALGGTDLQLGYFGINSMDSTATVNAAQVLPIFFNSVPVTPSGTSSFIYSTKLYSGEANLRFFTGKRFPTIVGLRYLKQEDHTTRSSLPAVVWSRIFEDEQQFVRRDSSASKGTLVALEKSRLDRQRQVWSHAQQDRRFCGSR